MILQEIFFVIYGNYSPDYIENLKNQPPVNGIQVQVIPDIEDNFKMFFNDFPFNEAFQEQAPTLYPKVTAAKYAIFIHGSWQNPANPLQNYTNILTHIHLLALSNETIAIIDTTLVKIFPKDEWLAQIGDPMLNGQYQLNEHIIIDFIPQEDGFYWMKTRGMMRFGKPELSVHDLPEDLADPYLSIMNTISSVMVFSNYLPEDGQQIQIDNEDTGILAKYEGSYDDEDYWGNIHIELSAA